MRSELYPMIIEGQALWEISFKEKFSELWKLEYELFETVQFYLEQMNPSHDAETKREYCRMRKQKRDILYLTDERTDSHLADCICALRPIEDYLRGKLGRRS